MQILHFGLSSIEQVIHAFKQVLHQINLHWKWWTVCGRYKVDQTNQLGRCLYFSRILYINIFCHFEAGNCVSFKRLKVLCDNSPKNTRRWTNADLMVGQRRRRWAIIESTLFQRLVFVGRHFCRRCSVDQTIQLGRRLFFTYTRIFFVIWTWIFCRNFQIFQTAFPASNDEKYWRDSSARLKEDAGFTRASIIHTIPFWESIIHAAFSAALSYRIMHEQHSRILTLAGNSSPAPGVSLDSQASTVPRY